MRLADLSPELLLGALAVALAAALVQTARLAFTRWLPRRRVELARAAGADGELRAEPLLRRLGYEVLARQAPGGYDLAVDGEPCAIALRADFLVARGGRRFVAEVKTGRLAPKLETSATRRQLLEYRVAFDVDGVLLVDVDAGRVRALEFPSPDARAPESGVGWLAWLALGGALGFAAAEAPRHAPVRAAAPASRSAR